MFGPVYLDAYSLEAEHADFPRVILDRKVSEETEAYKIHDKLGCFLDATLEALATINKIGLKYPALSNK